MASVATNKKTGLRRILFVGPKGRKTICVGDMPKSEAREIAAHVGKLVDAPKKNLPIPMATAAWLAGLSEDFYKKLVNVELVKSRTAKGETALAAFIDGYLAGRTDLKENTHIGLGQARRNLLAYFGEGKNLADITEGDAEEYARYLTTAKAADNAPIDTPVGVGLASNTARRLIGRAKQFFRFAVRKRIITANPFADVASSLRANPDRLFFITPAMAAKVLEKCPNAEWRLIFALSRFGGLRCPSEHLALKWGDVDFEAKKIRVPSPKTEHIEGKASRMIPMFPELEKELLAVYSEAEAGAEWVITRYRQPNQNLRTQFKKIIRRAGLEAWPRLFHNLRTTRETELMEIFPAHVVCGWIGNTVKVATAHYLQTTDEHFAQAVKPAPAKPAENDAHNRAQLSSEVAGSGGKSSPPEMQKSPENRANSLKQRGRRWPLSESNTSDKCQQNQSFPGDDAQNRAHFPADDDFAKLADAWPSLSPKQRERILKIASE
jgi:integrase